MTIGMRNHPSPPPTSPSLVLFNAKDYWEARLGEHPGLSGVGNTSLGHSYIQWMYKVRRAIFLRLLASLRTDLRTAEVFDVGSGTGFYLELWKQLGVSRLTGCDLTEIAVARLRSALPWARILRLDIGETLPATEIGSYDIVSAFDVLFHIVEEEPYERAIRNVCALLRPGGLLLFSDLLPRNAARRAEHVAFRPLGEVTTLLAKVGFDVVGRVPMFVVMEEPLDSMRQWYCFLWKLMIYPVRRSAFAGFVIGGVLYPLELILTRVFRESPATEIVVCCKRHAKAINK
jgi:SAM-dependent methyltransferase